MRAAALDHFGPPSLFEVRELPVPELGPREVLIAVHTAGVGIWDAKIRAGVWAIADEKFPLVLGTDGAGTIAAKGARVRRLELGERVWAYAYQNPKGGFYAEYVAVDADSVAPIPRSLDLVHAGTAAETALTAFQGVVDHLRVSKKGTCSGA